MEYKITNFNTKRMIADSLKKFLMKKPLSKVTVSELTKDCGVNRKTFYYHFADIRMLVKWMLEEEAFEVVSSFDIKTDFKSAILFTIDYVENNAVIIRRILSSLTRAELKYLLGDDFKKIVRGIIEQTQNIKKRTITDTFLDFITEMYAGIIGEIIINLVEESEVVQSRQRAVDYITTIFIEMVPALLDAAETKQL
ncbi:MAG: TetR/AcrR family transcriptional regulator [Treponema sp.]|nr:TetR/AcrR family transcriptional regulator [Treponema sp.]